MDARSGERDSSLLEMETESDSASDGGARRQGFRFGLKTAALVLGPMLILAVGLRCSGFHRTGTGSIHDATSLIAFPPALQQILGGFHMPPPPRLPFAPAPPPAYYQPPYGQPGVQPGVQPGAQFGAQPAMQPGVQPGMPGVYPGASPAVQVAQGAGAAAGVSGATVQAAPQQSYDCDTGYHISGWVSGWSESQMDFCCSTQQRGCREPRLMSFYMYRAQDDQNYPMENVNLGDLPGVMWYLHNEVIVSTPRKFNVTRLMRFRVTMKTTQESYNQRHQQFGQFTAFDTGKCTVPNCGSIFQRDGYVIGCQNTESSAHLGNYVSRSAFPCTPPNCKEGTWYSLPGPCPGYDYLNRPDYCNVTEPGGQCQFIYGEGGGGDGVTGFEVPPVSGQKDCAFYAKWAGQLYLNELIGLPITSLGQQVHYQEYSSWWQQGNQEYSVANDGGVCAEGVDCTFWNGRDDQMACAERMRKIEDMFDAKFPFYPPTASLGEAPPCNAA